MATSQEKTKKWEKFPILVVEDSLFLDTILTSNCADVFAKHIYDVIKDDDEVAENLKNIYREGLYGKDKNIKRRLHNRIYAMRRNNK